MAIKDTKELQCREREEGRGRGKVNHMNFPSHVRIERLLEEGVLKALTMRGSSSTCPA